MKINKICIVGGGSSGWMTAAAFAKLVPEVKVVLIESKEIKTVGVGESTLGKFNEYLRALDLKDKDWMPYCNATYKTSIAFKNFREGKGERFHYAFGKFSNNKNRENVNDFLHLPHIYPEVYSPEEIIRFFNPSTIVTEHNKILNTKIDGIEYNNDFDSAYHLDAEAFGEFLKNKIAIPGGVEHIIGNVESFVKDQQGYLKQIITDSKIVIEADLFIDCTGFKSLLLEKCMGSPFISFKNSLFNDKAVTTQIPYPNNDNSIINNYTDCIALGNGWVWDIPLWNRIGTGYVYSSTHITQDEAIKEFKNHLIKRYGKDIVDNIKINSINIKHGKHKEAWIKNVVGIGLSYGFIEPLESTGLLTTHENILSLIRIILNRKGVINKVDLDTFNFSSNTMVEGMKDFVALHYYLSSRKDTTYWKDCTETIEFENKDDDLFSSQIVKQELWNLYERKKVDLWSNYKHLGYFYIVTGQGELPFVKYESEVIRKYNKGYDRYLEQIHTEWQNEKIYLINLIKKLPTHYEYLKNNIYNEFRKRYV